MAPFFVAWRRNCASFCGCCPVAVHAMRHAICAIDQPQAIVGRTGCCETRKGEFLPAAPAASGAAQVSSGDDCMCGCSAGRMHVLETCAARSARRAGPSAKTFDPEAAVPRAKSPSTSLLETRDGTPRVAATRPPCHISSANGCARPGAIAHGGSLR